MNRKIRVFILAFIMFCLGALLLVNVLSLDLFGKTLVNEINYKNEVGVTTTTKRLVAQRGSIMDSDGNIITSDVKVYKIYFVLSENYVKYVRNEEGEMVKVPLYVVDKKETAKQIADALKADENYIYERLCLDRYQVEIGAAGSNISYDVKTYIDTLKLPGVYFTESTARYYSYSSMAAHLIGYVNKSIVDNEVVLTGTSGLEKQLDKYLTGVDGKSVFYSDVNNNIISGGMLSNVDAIAGYDVTLTLNKRIQQATDDMLEKMMKLSGVDKGWAIVMDAKSGAILSYDSYPSFDPNVMDITDFNDYCATLPYEPGSTMKTFTYAMAIDLGKFNANETFNSNNYYFVADKKGQPVRTTSDKTKMVIHNDGYKQYGDVTFERAYINSMNVGTVTLLEEKVGKEKFIEYSKAFKFYEPVNTLGIYEGSFAGYVNYDNVFSLACASFGSGNSVNALQIMQAYSTFANEGMMIKPYLVESIVDPTTGEVVYQGGREEIAQVVKPSTCTEINRLMGQVVASGLHKSATLLRISDCQVGCKTGTAPVVVDGAYSKDLVIHSVMISIPADNPQVYLYVAYQDNQGIQRNFKYINELEKVICSTLGISENQEDTPNTENEEVNRNYITLPELVNHSLSYVKGKNELSKMDVYVIGNGDTIVKQYPQGGMEVLDNSKLFLLTNDKEILMPNMQGWSRKEVVAFGEMTGLKIEITGSGYVDIQNIESNTLVNESDVIEVILK